MMASTRVRAFLPWALMAAFTILVTAVYAPGLSGGFLFDDYPNIVDNPGIRIDDINVRSIVRSAMSSPSSQLKRPIASLSFSANYIAAGMTPYAMKLTNLVIHLINGWLTFLLVRQLLIATGASQQRAAWVSAFCAGAWLLLPINLTAVLYVVQRMESLAQTFVLIGLLGYSISRRRMLIRRHLSDRILLIGSLTIPLAAGLLTKETAVMLPLYAFVLEFTIFKFLALQQPGQEPRRDNLIFWLYTLFLFAPMILGLIWLIPELLKPQAWSTRDFTMSSRLLSEARVVCDYLAWTIFPRPDDLSFYHDDFDISSGILTPWTTLFSIGLLAALLAFAVALRRRVPILSAGVLLFFASHLLTATILPLELVYEHRNYFASLGIILALASILSPGPDPESSLRAPRILVSSALLFWWTAVTATSAYAWGTPLRLAEELADRGPSSPRAQYELGRAYIIASRYQLSSPYTPLVYPPLLRAAAIRDATILPEQALIFFNARMHRSVDVAWWSSMEMKLRSNKVTVQDESALIALLQCDRSGACELPKDRMNAVFRAAIEHASPSSRLLASYGDFAWHTTHDETLALAMLTRAVKLSPDEPVYRITRIRILIDLHMFREAETARNELASLNTAGVLDKEVATIDTELAKH